MKKILVISPDESLFKGLMQSIGSSHYQFSREEDVEKAQVLFSLNSDVGFVFLDAAALGSDPAEEIRDVTGMARRTPVFVLVDGLTRALESDALMNGAAQVLEKPVSGDLVAELMSRYHRATDEESLLISPSRKDLRHSMVRDQENRMLQIARSFLEVPRFAGSSKAACQKTLTLLREMTGFRRVVLYFLRRPSANAQAAWKLELAYGVGRETLDRVELSTTTGLGARMIESGQILQFDSLAVENDREISRVFRELRIDAAIPVVADNHILGMVMVGGRVTGEVLNRQELLLLFYLLENLGMYLRRPGSAARSTSPSSRKADSVWPAGQAADPVAELLRHSIEAMPSAFLLVDDSMKILSANEEARRYFPTAVGDQTQSSAAALPESLRERIGRVFRREDDGQPLIVRMDPEGVRLLRCRVYPVKNAGSSGRKVVGICVEELKSAARVRESSQQLPSVSGSAAAELNGPSAVAAVKEDKPSGVTSAQLQTAGSDPDQSGFSRRVYDKLARQIHYSLVPLSTHAQLLDHGHYDEDFRDSLREVLGTGIHRFQRFSRQLSYMVRQQYDLSEQVDWKKLVEGAFEEAADNYEDPRASFEMLDESSPALIRCEEVAVKFALAEVFLNALQADSGNPQFLVKVKQRMSPNDPKGIEIIVRDMGSGFEPRALEKAFEPFFSTRPAGLGLGLTVAKKIIEGHFGSIHIRPTPAKNQHEVAILLPVT